MATGNSCMEQRGKLGFMGVLCGPKSCIHHGKARRLPRSCGSSPQLPRQVQELHPCLLISANSPALLSANNPLIAPSIENCPLEFCKFFLKPWCDDTASFQCRTAPGESQQAAMLGTLCTRTVSRLCSCLSWCWLLPWEKKDAAGNAGEQLSPPQEIRERRGGEQMLGQEKKDE